MNYKFPIIRTIDDVLPHIEGREEFIVAERDFGTVINYVVATADTFDMAGPDDVGGAVRRECRGIMFDHDGKILSRPFHKFFNVGERDETQMHVIDMSQQHVIMEKMDGSMIRPILVDGYLRLATKMGVTSVAMQAEEWLAAQSENVKSWLRSCIELGITPLFEWVSPLNQIVLNYDEADLVLLAMRDNITGEYKPADTKDIPFTIVPVYGSMQGDIKEYVARQREAEDREGDIIRFADGQMLKIKNDWYVRIHKAMDRIRYDRNIVDLIINEEIDDVVPMMPEKEIARVRDFETRFWEAFRTKENRLYGIRLAAQQSYEDDRKRIALEFVPTLKNKADAGLLFRMIDGRDLRELMLEHIEKHISTNTRWDVCAEWMGM